MPSRTRAGQTSTFGGPSCQVRPWWVAQAAAFLYCFQIHSRTNFSVSVFHARFHVSHFSTSPSDRKASPSSVDTASQRCARFLDNKQVSQAEILENQCILQKNQEFVQKWMEVHGTVENTGTEKSRTGILVYERPVYQHGKYG